MCNTDEEELTLKRSEALEQTQAFGRWQSAFKSSVQTKTKRNKPDANSRSNITSRELVIQVSEDSSRFRSIDSMMVYMKRRGEFSAS